MGRLRSGILALSCMLLLSLGLMAVPSSASAATGGVLGPINGSVSSPAASHLISYDGDWAMDIAGSGDVYARVSSAATVTLRIEQVSAACRDGRQGGTAVRVRAYLNGTSVAVLVYSHLAGVTLSSGQWIANGARLGRTAAGLPRDDRCWTGPHVHFEARNDSAFACYTPLGSGVGIGATTVIGQIGTVGATRIRQPCGSTPPSGSNPVGHYDSAASPTPGMIRVRGWSFDPDARTTPLSMHVYVGGEAGQAGASGHAFTASASRPDVAAAYPGVGNSHGLDQTFETSKRGSQRVCLYAINRGGGGNVLLGCKIVAIADPNPIGAYDTLNSPQPGTLRIRGWALDPNDRTRSLSMHVYVGGSAGQAGAEGHAFTAAASRPDVAAAYPGVGYAHGLDKTFGTSKRGRQMVCLYAIDVGAGDNVSLGCKAVTIATPPPVVSEPTPPAAPPLATNQSDLPLTIGGPSTGPTPAPDSEPPTVKIKRSRVRHGRKLRLAVAGIDDGSPLTVRFKRRGSKAIERAVNVNQGRARARAPRRRGRYVVTIRYDGNLLAKRKVKVR